MSSQEPLPLILPPANAPQEEEKQTITDKEFCKAMQKLKEKQNNAEIKAPKKSASAYILYGKKVRLFLSFLYSLLNRNGSKY